MKLLIACLTLLAHAIVLIAHHEAMQVLKAFLHGLHGESF